MRFRIYIQVVTRPTLKNNILDLVLVSSDSLVVDVINLPPFSTSDHDAIEFKIVGNEESSKKPYFKEKIRDFRNANYHDIESFLLTVSWPDLFEYCANVDQFYSIFLKVVHFSIEKFVPFKLVRNNTKKYTFEILKAQRKKKLLWRRLKRCNSESNMRRYKSQSKSVKIAIKNFYGDHESKLLNKHNLRHFFDFVNTRLKTKKTTFSLLHNNTLITSDVDKANILNNFSHQCS